MNVTIPDIRNLYDSGKAGRWNPHRDIDWSALSTESHDENTRQAARLTWSRRIWIEATGLTATPALIVRFCMEAGREIDPKFFLTTRNTEEAWHIECFDRIAEAFGGRVPRPTDRSYETVFNRNLHRRVLDAGQFLDSYVTVHAAFESGLGLELCRAWQRNATDPVIRAVLDRIVADRERHAAFGWLYIATRASHWTAEQRQCIADELTAHVRDTELRGYHCPWLAPEHALAEAEADAMTAAAGLGAASRTAEEDVLVAYVGNARARLAEFGVALPMFETNRMRSF
jgi:hypothetical protein